MLDRRRLRDFDVGLLLAALAMVAIGVVMIYSATHGHAGVDLSHIAQRQLVWAMVGLVAMVIAAFVSQDTLDALAPVLYGIALLLLMAVLVVGVGKAGERRWFDLGPLTLQPSELAKYAVIIVLARYLARRKTRLDRPIRLVIPLLLALVPAALVLREPDLGTSVIFLIILVPMLYWAGVRPFFLLLLMTPAISMLLALPASHAIAGNWYPWAIFLFLLGALLYVSRLFIVDKVIVFVTCTVTGLMGPLLWNRLADYQRHRVLAFLNPEKYRFSTGYQLIQSKIAVGSGSVLGKGFLGGTQKKYAFLPEQHTDFVFSVVAEEFGFLGCLIVLGLILFLVLRMFRLAGQVRNRFASLVIVGIASTLFVQSAINIGVTLGLSPVTGMPLPFLSYGGSSLVVTLASIGIVLGMGLRRMEY